jgi:hypothetical protein
MGEGSWLSISRASLGKVGIRQHRSGQQEQQGEDDVARSLVDGHWLPRRQPRST